MLCTIAVLAELLWKYKSSPNCFYFSILFEAFLNNQLLYKEIFVKIDTAFA